METRWEVLQLREREREREREKRHYKINSLGGSLPAQDVL